MKVAVFVKNLTSGGAEKQSVLLAKALSDACEVFYVILNGEKVHQKYLDLLCDSRQVTIQSFEGSLCNRYKSFRKYIREAEIDVIFSYLTAANFYAVMATQKMNIKVYTGLRNARLPFIKCVVDGFLTNFLAEKTIVNCYSGENYFVSKGFRKRKLEVISNCFENIDEYSCKKDREIIQIITVGRFVLQKDYETAIRAIAKLKERCGKIVFSIIGYGELEGQIRDWIKKYSVEDMVKVYINPDNIPILLGESDIYLSTSVFEGTSNSIMEGMNADLPVVATNVGDNDKLVIHGENGYLCEIGDYQTIADLLALLIKDRKMRLEMGRTSKLILEERYSVEIFKQRYLKLLGLKENLIQS